MPYDAVIYFTPSNAIPTPPVDFFSAATAIPIISYAFSVENSTSVGSTTSGAGAGKATFQEMMIVKSVDATSPVFFQYLVTGQHFQNMVLSLRTNGSIFYQFIAGLVFIDKIDQAGTAGGQALPLETLHLVYGSMAEKYFKRNTDGTVSTTPVSALWSQITNSSDIPAELQGILG